MDQMPMKTGTTEEESPYMQQVMDQMMNVREEDFTPMSVNIPVDAEDGETVSILLTGIAQNGRISGAKGVEFDMGGQNRGLGDRLSAQDAEVIEEE